MGHAEQYGLLKGDNKSEWYTNTESARKMIKREAIEIPMELVPPAPFEPVRINLNETINVKLTDLGKEIYYHQYDKINHIAGKEICKPQFPKNDENGYTEFPLWYFIQLYGKHIGVGLPNVIDPIEIVIDPIEIVYGGEQNE